MGLRLRIARPCHEHWASMRATARHCATCNREVRDLSDASAAEVLAVFAVSGRRSPCVRIRQQQREETLPCRASRPGMLALAAVATTALAGCTHARHPERPQLDGDLSSVAGCQSSWDSVRAPDRPVTPPATVDGDGEVGSICAIDPSAPACSEGHLVRVPYAATHARIPAHYRAECEETRGYWVGQGEIVHKCARDTLRE
jgi:hypothetical protein